MSAPADQAARDRALRLDRHVVTIAPAGSGKTGLLVRRALRALATVDEPESVVCITFTNKAAAEIRLRITEALELADGPAPAEAFGAALHADATAVRQRDRARVADRVVGEPKLGEGRVLHEGARQRFGTRITNPVSGKVNTDERCAGL